MNLKYPFLQEMTIFELAQLRLVAIKFQDYDFLREIDVVIKLIAEAMEKKNGCTY